MRSTLFMPSSRVLAMSVALSSIPERNLMEVRGGMGTLMYVGRYGTRFKHMCSLTVQKAKHGNRRAHLSFDLHIQALGQPAPRSWCTAQP